MNVFLAAEPNCAKDEGSTCDRVYDLTKTDWLARAAEPVLENGGRIILILVTALVMRYVAHRTIKRLTKGAVEGRTPRILRPLRERAPESWREAMSPVLALRREQRARTLASVAKSATSFVIFGIAFTMVLSELGIDLAPILASAGIVGVALGFGAQNLVRDFLSGIFMMVEDQYGVGDVIDLGEAIGTVEEVGLRITTLRDINGTVWYVRNGEVLRVGNKSQGYAVAVVDTPVGHKADIAVASKLAARTALALTAEGTDLAEDVMDEPEMLGVESVTPEGVMLRLSVKTRAGRQWVVERALRAAIKEAFDAEGIPPPAIVGPRPPEAV